MGRRKEGRRREGKNLFLVHSSLGGGKKLGKLSGDKVMVEGGRELEEEGFEDKLEKGRDPATFFLALGLRVVKLVQD